MIVFRLCIFDRTSIDVMLYSQCVISGGTCCYINFYVIKMVSVRFLHFWLIIRILYLLLSKKSCEEVLWDSEISCSLSNFQPLVYRDDRCQMVIFWFNHFFHLDAAVVPDFPVGALSRWLLIGPQHSLNTSLHLASSCAFLALNLNSAISPLSEGERAETQIQVLGMSLAIRESSGSSQLTELGKHLHLLKNREFTPVSPIPAQPHSVYLKLHSLPVRNLAPIVLNRLTSLPSRLMQPVSWPPSGISGPGPACTPAALAKFWALPKGKGRISLSRAVSLWWVPFLCL